jgi:hypothetical protein
MWLTVLAGAVVLTVQSTPVAPSPLVFDFEDGLQGWELHGSAQRVQTQVLGGEWAIFGDGLVLGTIELVEDIVIGTFDTGISLEIDLADVASMSVEQFFAGDVEQGTDFVAVLYGLELLENIFVGVLMRGESPDPAANPGVRTFDLSHIVGVPQLMIGWACWTCPPGFPDVPPEDPASALGFIDNITFHSVPEAASAILLGLALIGLAAARTRSGSLRQ